MLAAELIHRCWKNLEAVELATLDWVDWFTIADCRGRLGNIPPAEAEAAYYRKGRPTLKHAAGLGLTGVLCASASMLWVSLIIRALVMGGATSAAVGNKLARWY